MKKRTSTGEDISLKSIWLTLGANDFYNSFRNMGRRFMAHFNRSAHDDDALGKNLLLNYFRL